MIMKSNKLQKEYEELNKKYIKTFEEKSEYEYQLKMLKEENEHIRNQDEEIRTLHQNARKLKHDVKNHLMVIASYINNEEYEKAKEYTSEVLEKFNSMHSYVETGNSLMNHIINDKLQSARKKGIQVKAEIENLEFGKMRAIDFSAVLSNVLDNAKEASERENNIVPEIQVTIVQCKGYDTIGVKNRIEKSILQDNPSLETLKKEGNHGLGITQIKSIVEEYQGMCDFYEEDQFFCVKIFVPQ